MAQCLSEIFSIFNSLDSKELELKSIFEEYSIQFSDEVANACAHINNSINRVLKLYQNITEIDDKVMVKAQLKFYYELISQLIHFIKSIENFQRISDEYYDKILDFLENKYRLINGKYTEIVKKELDMFYSKEKRAMIEFLLEKRLNDPFKPNKI